MEKAIKEKVDQWLSAPIDDQTRNQIETWLEQGNEEELTESFYKDLEFGTGGLRGVMGVGSNRMNKYTIGMATQGLANYLKKSFKNQLITTVIAYDSRNNSKEFASITADVLSANGIKVYLFSELRPTPELSFAIRYLNAQSGVVITASHNPKKYNGYKAYWDDGGQLVPPHDKNVIEEVKKIDGIGAINFEKKEELIELIDEEIDQPYLEMIKGLSLHPEIIERQKELKIVYSPIHGTGITMVPKILSKFGFDNYTIVGNQSTPDGDFPTVVYPNPEEAEAMKFAIKRAEEGDADLVMATDPDSDRVGIAARNQSGDFELLNGNQTGSLLIYYLLNAWKENGKLDGKQYVVKTIVTTELITRMAEDFKVKSYDTLTGFKYIAELIRQIGKKGVFIGGGEESYGYLIGDQVRDKDAISSCAMIAELTAYAKDQQKSLFDLLIEMYQKYGFFLEKLISVTKEGRSGAEKINSMMKDFRENPPTAIDGSPITQILDYQAGTKLNTETGKTEDLNYPKSNVLQFISEDGTKISARPSGTEPKIKFYFSVNSALDQADKYLSVKEELEAKIDRIIKEFNL